METAMNDLEAVDNYIEKCRQFVNPRLLRDIESRGLYSVINYLPSEINEAKSVARARLSKMGKFFGDEQIDQIASEVQRIEFLRSELNKLSMTDCDKVIPVLTEMMRHADFVKNYFK